VDASPRVPGHLVEGSRRSAIAEGGVEGRAPITLGAGQVLFVPAGVAHTAKNVGRVEGAELATYVVEKERPLLSMVK
jgi:mannose-6-phosphate isomerase-like protein (cupin superfamily)